MKKRPEMAQLGSRRKHFGNNNKSVFAITIWQVMKGMNPVVVAQVDLRYPATLKEVSSNPTEYQYTLNKIKI